MHKVPGTTGYEVVVDAFAASSFALDFEEINADFLDYLPPLPARILDAGAGVGQNAAALVQRGYDVVAVEPLAAFIQAAKQHFKGLAITWLQDSLPALTSLDAHAETFDGVLMDGVWHHLNTEERRATVQRLSTLLKPGGVCCVSLRNGPAGAGTHVFPTDPGELREFADAFGFRVVLQLEHQPSQLKNKPHVIWSRVVIERC